MTPDQIKEARALVKRLKAVPPYWVDTASGEEAADALTAALDEIERLRAALSVYAEGCDATSHGTCGYGGNLCCMIARNALKGADQ